MPKKGSFTLKHDSEPEKPSHSAEGTASEYPHNQLKPLRNEKEVKKFLDAIRADFIRKVNVHDPNELVDLLIELGVLTETDNESIQGSHLPTPQEKARRVWTILYGIDHNVFRSKALPILCERHSHIIPEAFWNVAPWQQQSRQQKRLRDFCGNGWEVGGCTRCQIRFRMRSVTLADFLRDAKLMPVELYRDVIRNQRVCPQDPMWETIFNCFTELSTLKARQLQSDMTSLLTRHCLRVPDNIVGLIMSGFPCRCLRFGTVRRNMFHMERLTQRRPSRDSIDSDTSSPTVYPSSSLTDVSVSSRHDTVSLDSESSHTPSHDLCDAAIRYPSLDTISELNSPVAERGPDLRLRFLCELDDSYFDSPEFLSAGAMTLKLAKSFKRDSVMKAQTWHARSKSLDVNTPGGYKSGFATDSPETIGSSRESLASQVLKELHDARTRTESQHTEDASASSLPPAVDSVQPPRDQNAGGATPESPQCARQSVTTEAKAKTISQSPSPPHVDSRTDKKAATSNMSTQVKRQIAPTSSEGKTNVRFQLPPPTTTPPPQTPTPAHNGSKTDGSAGASNTSPQSKDKCLCPPLFS